jgi:2-amino-4-hydroxy-6-hydroxymethyldihydropteridine diphosphokinase
MIAAAVAELAARGVLRDAQVSPLYESAAVAEGHQPPYLNAVIRGDTRLSPDALLESCLDIEATLGRVRPLGQPKAPRTIDIDLLLYADKVIDTPTLKVPHPALLTRGFVLIPLADVAASRLVHPVTGVPLTAAGPSAAVKRIA